MKKLLFVLVLHLAVVTLPAQLAVPSSPDEVISAGKQFVELLSKKDFAGAVARFDDTMKAAMPEATLRDTWQTLQSQAGPFQKQLRATASKVQGYDVVLVTCKFKQTPLDAKVVFDPQGRVAGLFFVPSHAAFDPGSPPPYARTNSFSERDFTVGHGEWQLPGTLTLPTDGPGPWPAVVLVQGSGPEDRDETVGANKPFRDLAWGLASRGIAVLRYEKRTKEYATKLRTNRLAHFTVQEETIDDALSAAGQLHSTEGVDSKRIFVLGHSLGGIVAPRIGQTDVHLAGLILLAGTLCRPFEDLMVSQIRYLNSLQGKPSPKAEAQLAEFEATAVKVKNLTTADASSTTILFGAPPSYWLDLRDHDSLAIARKLQQPLLILQGGRDYQMPPEDFKLWQAAFSGQTNATFKLYPKLNHLFIAGEGQSTPEEYNDPGHVAEPVVTDIAAWIKAR